MNIYKTAPLLFLIALVNCAVVAKECPQGINLLPMYGRQDKCAGQLSSDSIFLAESDKLFKSRSEAAQVYCQKAWAYYHNNETDLAMKRFNQAWLLDSTQADIYWGFGCILGTREQHEATIPFFERSISLNPDNPLAFEALATAYTHMFVETQNAMFLHKSIEKCKQAISLNPEEARFYANIAIDYVYLNQRDSVMNYVDKADKLDPAIITAEQRSLIDAMSPQK